MEDNFNKKHKKKWSTGKKVSISILLIICISIIGIGIYAINILNKYDKISYSEDDISVSPQVHDELKEFTDDNHLDKITNIALFGIDADEGENGRSDSIMILTVDPVKNKLKLSSIIKDWYVEIDGYGKDKINHAFAYGNSVLALKTINDNFGLNVDNFIAVNFTSMPEIIDKLGGIDIELTEEEISQIPNVTTAGMNHLNGEQALSYARIRYASGNDYQRTSRHRTILSALFKKALKISPTEYPSLLSDFLPLVQTNFSPTELLSLANEIYSLGSDNLVEDRFPRDEDCDGEMIDDVFYIVFDIEKVKNDMREFIYKN